MCKLNLRNCRPYTKIHEKLFVTVCLKLEPFKDCDPNIFESILLLNSNKNANEKENDFLSTEKKLHKVSPPDFSPKTPQTPLILMGEHSSQPYKENF